MKLLKYSLTTYINHKKYLKSYVESIFRCISSLTANFKCEKIKIIMLIIATQ